MNTQQYQNICKAVDTVLNDKREIRICSKDFMTKGNVLYEGTVYDFFDQDYLTYDDILEDLVSVCCYKIENPKEGWNLEELETEEDYLDVCKDIICEEADSYAQSWLVE